MTSKWPETPQWYYINVKRSHLKGLLKRRVTTTLVVSSALGLIVSHGGQPYVCLFAVTPSLLITHLTHQFLSLQRTSPEQKHRGHEYKQKGLHCCVCDLLHFMIIKLSFDHFRKNEKQTVMNKEKIIQNPIIPSPSNHLWCHFSILSKFLLLF